MLNLQRIKLIRYSLSIDTCKQLVQCLVISHLDYANSILAGLPLCAINKLQRVQNMAAKLILKRNYQDSATDCLKSLHWLPIKARIDFKVLLLIFKCFNKTAPNYLSNLIDAKKQSRPGLRSNSNSKILNVPFTKQKTFADRSFSVYWPRLWNSLPDNIRTCDNLNSFRKLIKTQGI